MKDHPPQPQPQPRRPQPLRIVPIAMEGTGTRLGAIDPPAPAADPAPPR